MVNDGRSRLADRTKRRGRPKVYGITEIAVALDAQADTVHKWRQRGSFDMPAPDAILQTGPVWLAATIEPWILKRQSAILDKVVDDMVVHP